MKTFQGVALLFFCLWAYADQNHPDLDGLFAQLKSAETGRESSRIEQQIWQRWMLFPDDSSAAETFVNGVTAMNAGQFTRSQVLLDSVIEDYPSFAEAWNKRATLRFLQRDFDGSIADIGQTLILEPRHFGALAGLAQIFVLQDRFLLALEVIEQMRNISPNSSGLQALEDLARQGLEDSAT